MIDVLHFGAGNSHFLALFQILFKNRFKNDNGSNCLLIIDGADFKPPVTARDIIFTSSRGVV